LSGSCDLEFERLDRYAEAMGAMVRAFFAGEVVVRRSRGPAVCEPHLIPTIPLHNLVLLSRTPTTVHRLDGGATRWRQLAMEPGELHFCSAGTAGTQVGWRTRGRSGPEYLGVLIDPRRIVRAACENGGQASPDLESRDKVRHPLLEQIVRTMAEAVSRADAADDLLIDAAAELVAVALARDFVARARIPLVARREKPLSTQTVGRVVEYIDANLAQHVRVSELAALTGLSSFHFSRAFKAATGQSPYAFALARRVLRARQLLGTEMPLAEIALTVGFASQSHLTEHFRRLVGVTPGRIRRDR
jgi:AraC-like DNA-binding protein